MAGVGAGLCPDIRSCIPKLFPVIQDSIRSIHQGAKSMTNASRITIIRFLAFGVVVLAATVWAQNRPPILEQIAKTYGLDSYGQIEAIRYTWNGEIHVGKDNRVEYLVFHHGGTKKPSLVNATWAGYKKAGPLLFSTEHRGFADGKPLHIFISDVAVKVTGSDKWMPAQ